MRIVFSGYYGFDNAGDEALLSAITQSIRAVLQDTPHFTVLSGNPQKTTSMHGLHAVHRMHPIELIRELKNADLLVSGGGSLLQDVTGWRSIPYYLGIAALAKCLGTPVIFYAQGIGPVRRRLGKWLIRLVANRVDYITLRDDESAAVLTSMGVNRPPVLVTADPVFSMRPTDAEMEWASAYMDSMNLASDKPIIGLSLRSWEAFDDRSWIRLVDLLQDAGYQVVLLPMQHPEDVHYAEIIIQGARQRPAIADQPMKSTQMMALIARLDLLIGMRLHALIFAACMGIPFAGIAYDPKVVSFLARFGFVPLIQQNEYDADYVIGIVGSLLKNSAVVDNIRRKAGALKEKSDRTPEIALAVARRKY